MNQNKIHNLQQTLDLLPGIWCIVDSNSCYLYYNLAYADLVGIADKPKSYLIGKTVAAMHCNASQCASIFWKEDALVKSTKKKQRFLNCIQMVDGLWKILQIDKQPIIDLNGNVEAIVFHLIDQSANHNLDLALKMAKASKTRQPDPSGILIDISNSAKKIKLKPKESECLFYLIRGFSYKQISSIQNISYRTVVDHIERLKMKLNATTTQELITLALAAGYPGAVPQNYFDQQISIILSS